MNTLFKTLAAVAAAFTLVASAFAVEYKPLDGAKVYDCRAPADKTSFKTEVLTEYTAKEIRELAAAGLKPASRTYWAVTTAKKCEDLMVKPATQVQAKVLGGRPQVLDPQHTRSVVDYCNNNGEAYRYVVTSGKIVEWPRGERCTLDTKLTVTLAPNV